MVISKELTIIAPTIGASPLTPSISEEGEKKKKELLAAADKTLAVELTTTKERDLAIKVAAQIKGHVNGIEEARKEFKNPFYQMGCKIDTVAKEHREQLDTALADLNRVIGVFNEAEAKRIRDEQEAVETERLRLLAVAEGIRKDAEKKEQEAQQRIEDTGKPLPKKIETALLKESLQAETKLEEINKQSKQLQDNQLQLAEQARKSKASGGAQRQDIIIEVTDIKKLYAAHPECVRMDADLATIKYLINTRRDPNFVIPGVIWRKQANFSVKGI